MPIRPAGSDSVDVKKNYNLQTEIQYYIDEILQKRLASYAFNSGIGGQERPENKPYYKNLPNEVVLEGKTNSFIILGGDRDSGPLSGYGGLGYTGAATIDLVAGLSGQSPIGILNGEVQETSKNFSRDAARIYISQKSDIDAYLGIPLIEFAINGNGNRLSTETTVGKSAIAIVADCTRIIGRNTVKIVTSHAGQDSTDNDVERNGIDIIAGYDLLSNNLKQYSLQPMVKGNNLMQMLKEMIESISTLHASVRQLEKIQADINVLLANHTHLAGTTMSDTMVGNSEILSLCQDYLQKVEGDGQSVEVSFGTLSDTFFRAGQENFILSSFNRTN